MTEEIKVEEMKVAEKPDELPETEATEEKPEAPKEEKATESEEVPAEESETTEGEAEASDETTDESPDASGKLPFPEAAVVRIMKKNLDSEKMIKKDVKIAMNKWLGEVCAIVARNMNKFPYVMMNMNEFKEGTKVYENLEEFQNEKDRVLAHLGAIKKDIEKLERDLGKMELEGEEIRIEKTKEE